MLFPSEAWNAAAQAIVDGPDDDVAVYLQCGSGLDEADLGFHGSVYGKYEVHH